MTGRERALRTLNFEEVDRVPLVGGWLQHSGFMSEITGRDFWKSPEEVALEAYRRLEVDLIPQLVTPFSPEMEYMHKDYRKDIEAAKNNFPDMESVLRFIDGLPSPGKLRQDFDLDAGSKAYLDQVKSREKKAGDSFLWLPGFAAACCSFMWYCSFGYENYFLAMMLHPDHISRLFEYSGERGYLQNQAVVKATKENGLPPFVFIGEDICDNRGPMVSLKLLDEIYFPYLRRALEPLNEAGIKMIWHCDGNVNPVIDTLINLGIDGFQGFQEEAGVSLEKLAGKKTKKGRKPILWGSISVTTTLPFGTVEDVKKDIERCIDVAAPGGGFFLAPSSAIEPEVPKENIYTLYEYGKTYGHRGN